jgi:lipopolysaccharide export system ATP-binding protein
LILKAESLQKSYKGRRVVNGVSFQLAQGEIVGLLGPNGAGKTTTFYMTTGLIRPDSGTVWLDEQDVSHWPMYQRSRHGVGYLPQEASVFRKLSVEENLRLVLELVGVKSKEIDERIQRLAEELHITARLTSPGYVLSGGERRRVEIARALATEPKFILLDEPFTGIDPVTIEEIQEIIFRLKNRGIGILITDHNIMATLQITDRNYILVDGKILKEGSGEEIKADEGVRKRYLGAMFDNDYNESDSDSVARKKRRFRRGHSESLPGDEASTEPPSKSTESEKSSPPDKPSGSSEGGA